MSSTMDTMAERLAKALDQRGKKPADLIASTKLSRAAIYFLLDGTTTAAKVRAETVSKVCKALGISRDWLLHGRGDMDATAAVEDSDSSHSPHPPESIPSQPERLDDDIMNRAFELLYLLADARPEDRRFARLSWPMVKVAAKWIARAESQRDAVKGMLDEVEEVFR